LTPNSGRVFQDVEGHAPAFAMLLEAPIKKVLEQTFREGSTRRS
jgi:hypothetical protein